MKVFLDANIIFSAAATDGAIRSLLGLIEDAGHECWADAFVVEEARRNIEAKSPDATVGLEGLIKRLQLVEAGRQIPPSADFGKLPDKDRPVLEAAVRAGCQLLVTGDRTHFGAFYGRTLAGVAIHSPRSLLDALDL